MNQNIMQELKKYANCHKTRSEPPDINDPYKMDLV